MAGKRAAAWATAGMAALVAAASCDGVLGISQLGPGPSDDGGRPDATTESGSGGGSSSGSSSGSGSGSSSGADSGSDVGVADADGGACTDACTLGRTQCSGNGVQTCVTGSGGCTVWGAAVTCASGTCAGGQCTGACSPPGATQCSGNGLQTCTGGQWGSPVACVNQTCVAGTDGDAGCTGVCAPGQTHPVGCGNCNSGTDLQTCSATGAWQTSGTCTGQGCAPNAMQACNMYGMQTCSASCAWGACSCASTPVCTPNATQCSGGAMQTCSACGQWGSAVGCGSGQICSDAGTCVTPLPPPSCAPGGAGMTTCPGGTGSGSCCASLEVTGGTYSRTYTNSGSGPTGTADPATVSSFRLDEYEVTVGRFRQFVAAWNGGSGWLPAAGSGKHTHLNGGQGLANSGSPGTFETGWVMADNSNIAPTTANLSCDSSYQTWTASAGSQENLPINCVNWWESYAFCIWDGGFLPSEAEWEYAAAGGSQEREYPWGSTAPGTACPGTGCEYAIYNCDYPSGSGSCTGVTNIAPVGTATQGAGLYGQLDLAGNVWEWNLDWYATYVNPCTDCAYLTAASHRVVRGGSFNYTATYLLPPYRNHFPPTGRLYNFGFRCARTP